MSEEKPRPWAEWAKHAKIAKPAGWVARKPSAVRKKVAATLPEWMLQSHMMAEFNKLEQDGWRISAVADMNAGKRGRWAAQQAIAMGMKKGEPDVRLYGNNGRTLFIEVKTIKGRRSVAQDERHARLGELGFQVLIATPTDEAHARQLAREIATKFCGESK